MFEAEFANKLPELKDREDCLTSSIFGTLKYLSPEEGLLPVLSEAFNPKSKKKLSEYIISNKIVAENIKNIELCFWPRSTEFGEPDIVIIIHGVDKDYAIIVEVKYYSYKHGEGEHDQLKKYYMALNSMTNRATFTCKAVKEFTGDLLAIVYLTQFEANEEIADSLQAFDYKSRKDAEAKFFHLKWQSVTRIIETLSDNAKDLYKKRIYADIYKLLDLKNLTPFKGFSDICGELTLDQLMQSPIFFGAAGSFFRKQFNGFSSIPDGMKTSYNKTIYYGG